MELQEQPDVVSMLTHLEAAYQFLADHYHAPVQERERLAGVLADLQWYAQRLGAASWEQVLKPSHHGHPWAQKWANLQPLYQKTKRRECSNIGLNGSLFSKKSVTLLAELPERLICSPVPILILKSDY